MVGGLGAVRATCASARLSRTRIDLSSIGTFASRARFDNLYTFAELKRSRSGQLRDERPGRMTRKIHRRSRRECYAANDHFHLTIAGPTVPPIMQ